MAGVQDLLNQAVTPTTTGTSQSVMQNVDSISSSKQDAVAAASASKQQALGTPNMYNVAAGRNSGYGSASAQTPLEADLLNMSDVDLIGKYGSAQGIDLANQRATGNAEFTNDLLAPRTGNQAIADSVIGVGMGLGNSVLGIGALGAGLVNDDAGVWAANVADEFNKNAQNAQSASLNAQRQASQAQAELGYRDNTKQFEEDKANDGNFIASLRRIGRDAGVALDTTLDSGAMTGDGLSQAVGSLLTAGPLGKGLSAAGKLIVNPATRRAIGLAGELDAAAGTTSAARVLSSIGSKVPEHASTMAAIGLMEGGGAYQQATQEAYEKLKGRTDLTEDQKVEMANRAGLVSAAIQGPLAAATGSIAAKFEANPLGAKSLREIGQNILKEGAEETVQSATGQAAQNYGLKQEVDPNRSLSEGVGEQAALGGLFGLGAGGLVQTPSLVNVTAGNAARGVKDAITDRIGSVTANNEQASPVSNAKVSEAAQVIQEAAPQAVQEAQQAVADDSSMDEGRKQEINDYVDALAGAFNFEPTELETVSPETASAIGNATNRVDAMHNMADFVANQSNDDLSRLKVMQELNAFTDMLDGFIQSEPEGLTGLDESHPARQLADGVQNLITKIGQTPSIRKAQEAMTRIAEGAQTDALIEPVTEASLSTPEGQQNVQNHVTIAEYAPEKANLDAVETILRHARTGAVQLSPKQRTALETAASILNAAKQYDAEAEAQGLRPQDIVSKQIKTDESRSDASSYSALQHAKEVRRSYSAGNFEAARSQLLDFQKFAQHMQNKVAAINSHLASGNNDANRSVRYQALQDDRTFRESKNGLGVNTGSARSVAFAKQVGLESQTLTNLVNSLATAFPELNVSHLEQTPLDPLLAQGTPQQVAQEFRDGTRKVGQNVASNTTSKGSQDVTEENKTSPQTAETMSDEQIKNLSDEELNAAMSDASGRLAQGFNAVDNENFSRMSDEQAARSEATKEDSKPEPQETDTKSVEENVTTVTEPVEEKPADINEHFSSLVQPKAGNKFLSAFKFPKTDRTHIVREANPVAFVKEALSASTVTDQGYTVQAPISRAYNKYLNLAPAIYRGMNNQLQAWATTPDTKGRQPGIEFLEGRTDANTWQSGKLLNIVDNKNGKLQLNSQLSQSAILAGLHWALNANNFTNPIDNEGVAKRLGIPEMSVNDELTEFFNSGMTALDAQQSLAKKVKQFWGVSNNADEKIGYTDGIPSAMAGELLESMVSNGLINETRAQIAYTLQPGLEDIPENRGIYFLVPADSKLEKGQKQLTMFNMYSINPENEFMSPDNEMRQYPDAIEHAVMVDPENVMFFGDDKVPLSRTQLNSDWVPVTKEQATVIANNNATPYYPHMPMVNLYSELGEKNILDLLGEGDLAGNTNVFNKNYMKTLEGRNLSIQSAFRQLQNVMTAAQNRADTAGIPVEELTHHYGHAITSVNRLQMLGKQNPQSSKLVREAIMSTWSTLDMNQKENSDKFMLAMAQALGVKVHNMPLADSVREAENMLEGDLSDAVQMLGEFHRTGNLPRDAVQTLRDAFGGKKLAPMELQAISEYARLQNATDEERAAFRTPAYVEADGMTNGVINAISLMTSGAFTEGELANLSRGGVTVGGNENDTANNIRTANNEDMYTSTVKILKNVLGSLKNHLEPTPLVKQQMLNVERLMALFMPGDVSLNANGDLELKRGVTKNPLTITLYGSGTQGIAGKFVKQITDGIYQTISLANERLKNNPDMDAREALFPGQPENAEMFSNIMDDLLSSVAANKQGKFSLVNSNAELMDLQNMAEFTFNSAQLRALQGNLHTLFVQPMRMAIDKSVGESVMENTTLIRRATQAQSIYLQEAFKKAVAERVQWNVDNTPGYKKTEFLSQRELNDIRESLSSLAPLVTTGTQNFFIAGSQNTDVQGSLLSRNFSGKFAAQTMVAGPSDSGVSGIPFMNIGMGDGQMVQSAYVGKDAPQKSTPIFDGVNLALDRMNEDSRTMNKAVYTAWQNNPLRAVLNAYDTLMTQADSAYPEAAHAALVKAVIDDAAAVKDPASVSKEAVKAAMVALQTQLANAADNIDARHDLMSKVQLAVDQMAATGNPYVQTGPAVQGTFAEKAHTLNQMLEGKVSTEAPKPVNKAVKAATVADKSGARVLPQSNLRSLFANAEPTQKKLFQMLMRTMPNRYFKVVTGNAQELAQYALDNNITLETDDGSNPFADGVNGLYHRRSNTIFAMSATPETVLHEMIHAATIDRVSAVLNGEDLGPLTGVYEDAVENIRTLMNDFLTMDIGDFTVEQQMEMNHARTEINHWLMSGHPVAESYAINEFMAWSLANNKIESAQRTVKANPIVQLAKDAVKFLKQLVFGRKRIAENPGEDMFSNLSFNTNILLGSPVTTQGLTSDTVAFQNRAYGNDHHLQEIIDAFEGTVNNYLNAAPDVQVKSARKTEYSNGLMAGQRMLNIATAHGFPMTMQQASAYSMIVAALQTQAKIDPNAMTRMQDLFSHVTKNLTVEDLMDKNAVDIPSEESIAQERYSVLMGNYGTQTDAVGRSALLPSFMALTMVSPLLRETLSSMPLPKTERNDAGTLDAVLENAGQNALNALSRSMSGEKGENVQAAIDALTNRIVDVAQNRETFIDQYASTTGGYVDRANQIMTDTLEKLSGNLMDAGEKLKGSHNKYVGALGSSLRIIGAIATEQNGAHVAEGVMAAMNRMRGMQPWFDLVNDMVGRTSSNANVYDMIKAVRALVQQDRQQFRQHLPTVIADKFSRNLSDREWEIVHRGLAKTDLTSLRTGFTDEEIHALIADPKNLSNAIDRMEKAIEAQDSANAGTYRSKADQLAEYMINGTVGRNLLRNANAISALLGEPKRGNAAKDAAVTQQIDHLVTMYALSKLGLRERIELSNLVQTESEGMSFSMAYMQGQRAEEMRKAESSPRAFFNQYKGYIPSNQQEGVSLIIADDADYDRLSKMSYERVAPYNASSLEPGAASRSYYFAPVSGRAVFNQGIMQNIRMTANGVDTSTGFTVGITGGVIADKATVERIRNQKRSNETGENLMPIYDRGGNVVAYERSVAPEQLARLNRDTHFARNVGVWRGRQVEEIRAHGVNQKLVDAVSKMYNKDVTADPSNDNMYVNVFESDDKVVQDAVKLFTPEIKDYMAKVFGGENIFMVRRDMLADTLGYREATVGDAWTGNSRWNDRTLKTAQNVALAMYGNKAYQYATNSEKFIQNLMRDARQMIIVKSVVVPVANTLGNIYQLISRGVPLVNVARQIPRKLAEINTYTKTRVRQIELEAELRATDNIVEQRKINAEIQSIVDSHKRMSIWPLIEAGEFSAINDASLDESDIELTSGRLYSYFEQKINQLPQAVRTAGRYALITQDTPLFKALEKSVEYGDFIAKAVLYDDIVNRQGKDSAYALSRVTEEFVNYDRLPGRFRSYMEKMGLMWFYNFKIRSAKVAMSILRNNPVHALMGAMMPQPSIFGNVGSPITDNIFTVAGDGRLNFSFGIGQAIRAPMLNPWVNIMSQ
uniref:Virion RNA polymerase n=1 Tax=Erwinia phage Fifi051 TaxID=3238787 RepID=A0AB39ACM0_9CAUD